jgi:hypothetical protein
MLEYNIEERNIYNIDKKGFAISLIKRTKRVFSKVI